MKKRILRFNAIKAYETILHPRDLRRILGNVQLERKKRKKERKKNAVRVVTGKETVRSSPAAAVANFSHLSLRCIVHLYSLHIAEEQTCASNNLAS